MRLARGSPGRMAAWPSELLQHWKEYPGAGRLFAWQHRAHDTQGNAATDGSNDLVEAVALGSLPCLHAERTSKDENKS